MDMRFFWLKDRVQQGQFTVAHISGQWNIADHSTKALPKDNFLQFVHYLTVNMDNEKSETKSKTQTITIPKRERE